MYAPAYLALFGFAMLWSLMIHDQVRWVPFRFVNHTGCHTAHHWYFRYNYGNYFIFWDWLCGTYFDPEGLPEKFTASKKAMLGRGFTGSALSASSAERMSARPEEN